MEIVHLPVMPGEVIECLAVRMEGTYVDATVGPGGHSEAILGRLGPAGSLICIDRDQGAIEAARRRLGGDSRVRFSHGRFSELPAILAAMGMPPGVDGVLMDFGISMLQLKGGGHGMSFTAEEPLDMRMDLNADTPTAADIVNGWPESELARLIYEYGEEHRSRRIARYIVESRRRSTITTCSELASIVARAIGGGGRTHPATRVFQAIRIAVNDEIGEVRRGVEAAIGVLAPGGRLVTIAYHSLEDREVKNFFREMGRSGRLNVITKKPLVPAREEQRANPSSRSAKLRAAEAPRV